MDSMLSLQIGIWIGVVFAVGEHVFIVFSESIYAERHTRMLRGEVIGHTTAAVVFLVVGAMLAKWAVSPSAVLPAMLLWFVVFNIHGRHRQMTVALLRGAVVRALASGQPARAKGLGARLFDLMIRDRMIGTSRSAKWRFAKSAMVLARMRETLGDYRLAERLYGWALSDFVQAGTTKDGSIRLRHLVRAIDAGCGEVRAAAFRDPAKAQSLLKMVEELARSAGTPGAAAKVVMIGGQVSTLDALMSQGSVSDAILAKASLAVTDYDSVPTYEEKYAAFVLARRLSARNDLKAALSISERVSRSLVEHVDVRDFFLWLRNEELRGALLERTAKFGEARDILSALTVAILDRFPRLAQDGNERELLSLSDVAGGVVTRLVGLTAERFADQSELVESAYDAVIGLKGIAASVRLTVGGALPTNVADRLQAEARKAVELRARIARRWTGDATSIAGELEAIELERLEALLVSERLREKAQWTSQDANVRTVRECLCNGERLFEFVRTSSANGEPRYVMFTFSTVDGDGVRLADIGPASPIDTAVTRWRTLVQLGANPTLSEPNTALLQTHVIDHMLGSGDDPRWTIVTDGALASLSFEAFFERDARHLVEVYECGYLSTSRELLLRRRSRSSEGSGPVVVAAPDYERSAHWPTQDDASRSRMFEPLPLAASEGARVATLIDAQLFAGPDATVSRLKELASPRILHIATHAFALDESDRSTTSALPGIPAWERLRRADDPMLRAGLALAGVNAVCRGEAVPPDVEGGLLSALEASALDLRNADLVVLSACDTGRGQLHRGDGILGLRRGFSIAGARAIVISLWRVPDAQTCDLMIDFYSGIVTKMTFAQALRRAKLNVIREHPQPLYWAGFVCSGDANRQFEQLNER